MVSHVYSVLQRDTRDEYVGVTSQSVDYRWRQHVTQARRRPKGRLQREIRRVGEGMFDVKVRAELPTYEEAQIAERILIAIEQPSLNALLGGQGRLGVSTHEVSPEARQRIAAAQRGRIVTRETRQKLSDARRGQPGPRPSAETRAKLSAAQTGNTKMLGRTHSPETKAKMRAAAEGRKHSAETRAKISASVKEARSKGITTP